MATHKPRQQHCSTEAETVLRLPHTLDSNSWTPNWRAQAWDNTCNVKVL